MSQSDILISQEELKKKEGLFSKKNRRILSDPLSENNPITVQVLGICSALAVTTQLKPAIVMGISVVAVLACANLIVSFLRNLIPNRIRIIVELVVISTLVILVDLILKAFVYDVSKQLSVFVGLIITNCIIMGRLEAFAMANKPWPSLLDAFGSGFGYAWILVAVAFFRELFGSGKLLGYAVIPETWFAQGYVNNGVMVYPVGAAIIVGLIIWVQRSITGKTEEN